MFRLQFLVCFLLFALPCVAQQGDSLYAKMGENGWVVHHHIKAGETVFTVARRYHVPPAMLADFNHISYQKMPEANTFLLVPVGAYNFVSAPPVRMSEARPLFFLSDGEIGLHRISRNSGVSQKTIREWNKMDNTELRRGQKLLVGWILYDATGLAAPPPATKPVAAGNKFPTESRDSDRKKAKTEVIEYIIVKPADTIKNDTLSEGERQYLSQTDGGQDIVTEKGTAVFFPRTGKADNGIYFAFHNTAKKGSIIRIANVGNEKVIYARVIGPVPGTGRYHNAILGISSDARLALEAYGEKVFCELRYGR